MDCVLTPSDITNRKFEKAAFGYRQEEVDSFVADVASS
ncbi:DivIVA domain-containing protein, partial [Bacteroides uniformis]|nr:DivIVA domain-containing protein [Bacteroides uniformis]